MTNYNDLVKDIHDYSVDIINRHIFLNNYPSAIDDGNPGVEHKMANTFIKNIRILDSINNDQIIIHMHSIGGNWNDGMAIFDAITNCKSRICIIVYGQAESMSSIILQAADCRIMMPNAYFMCHFGSSGLSGNYLDVQQIAAFEKRIVDRMLNIYAESCAGGKFFTEQIPKPSPGKIKAFLKRKFKDGDWYLDAEECVYYGFADGVFGSKNFKNIASI